MHRQRSNITRSDGPVLSDKMPGVPAIWLLHRYEQMHDMTVVLPVPDLVHKPAKLAVEIQGDRRDDARWAINSRESRRLL